MMVRHGNIVGRPNHHLCLIKGFSSLRIAILKALKLGPKTSTGFTNPCGNKEEFDMQSEKGVRKNALQLYMYSYNRLSITCTK